MLRMLLAFAAALGFLVAAGQAAPNKQEVQQSGKRPARVVLGNGEVKKLDAEAGTFVVAVVINADGKTADKEFKVTPETKFIINQDSAGTKKREVKGQAGFK